MKKNFIKIILVALISLTLINLKTSAHPGEAQLCAGITRICVAQITARSEVTPEDLETCKNCCNQADSSVSMATNKINFCGRTCKQKCAAAFRKKGGRRLSENSLYRN